MVGVPDYSKTREKKKKNKLLKFKLRSGHAHPFRLPKGSVRALIAVLLTILLGTLVIMERNVPADIALVWVSFMSYYVGHRTSINEKN